MCHLRLNLWLQKLTETLWSLLPVELPGVPLWIIFTNKKVIPATGIHFRKVRLAFCRFSCQRLKDDKVTARKHTRPVGRPHGKFYSSATDVHSPMRAGEWNFTPLQNRRDPIFFFAISDLLFFFFGFPRTPIVRRKQTSKASSDFQNNQCTPRF